MFDIEHNRRSAHASVTAYEPATAVVVVGMSAGALPALKAIVQGLPPTFGASLIIAHHAGTGSMLPQLVRGWAKHPVEWACHGALLRRGRIYVNPPAHHLIVNPDGRLSLSGKERVRFVRPSIDWLFETVAASYGRHAVAIVLSGGNADGAAGARHIRKAGGVVFVQSPTSCGTPSMPLATLASLRAKRVYSPDQLPRAILARLRRISISPGCCDWEEPFSASILDARQIPSGLGR